MKIKIIYTGGNKNTQDIKKINLELELLGFNFELYESDDFLSTFEMLKERLYGYKNYMYPDMEKFKYEEIKYEIEELLENNFNYNFLNSYKNYIFNNFDYITTKYEKRNEYLLIQEYEKQYNDLEILIRDFKLYFTNLNNKRKNNRNLDVEQLKKHNQEFESKLNEYINTAKGRKNNRKSDDQLKSDFTEKYNKKNKLENEIAKNENFGEDNKFLNFIKKIIDDENELFKKFSFTNLIYINEDGDEDEDLIKLRYLFIEFFYIQNEGNRREINFELKIEDQEIDLSEDEKKEIEDEKKYIQDKIGNIKNSILANTFSLDEDTLKNEVKNYDKSFSNKYPIIINKLIDKETRDLPVDQLILEEKRFKLFIKKYIQDDNKFKNDIIQKIKIIFSKSFNDIPKHFKHYLLLLSKGKFFYNLFDPKEEFTNFKIIKEYEYFFKFILILFINESYSDDMVLYILYVLYEKIKINYFVDKSFRDFINFFINNLNYFSGRFLIRL